MFDFLKVKKGISKWWHGEAYENDPDDNFIFIGVRVRHWTSRWAHNIVDYAKDNHKFIITTLLALVGVLTAFLV